MRRGEGREATDRATGTTRGQGGGDPERRREGPECGYAEQGVGGRLAGRQTNSEASEATRRELRN